MTLIGCDVSGRCFSGRGARSGWAGAKELPRHLTFYIMHDF